MIYDYEKANTVIEEAWKLAVKHLEDTLGDQYSCNVTENAMEKFWDYVQQDIEYKKQCPYCGNVDDEGNFTYSKLEPDIEICYYCYQKEFTK